MWKTASLVILTVVLGLPLILAPHAILADREVRQMRGVYLRDRAANVAARLESLDPQAQPEAALDELAAVEPSLLGLRIFRPGDSDSGDPAVAAIRESRELFHTEERQGAFVAYVPFHAGGETRVARIELSASAPDFLLAHARHNLVLAGISALAMLVVALLGVWSMKRIGALERRHMEVERLAELGRLSAVLAHEIRNPLGAIKGFAQLAREGADGPSARPLDAIVRESLRLENLVHSLLLYGRPAEPRIRDVEWGQLAADLSQAASEAIGTRQIQFLSEPGIQRMRTDPDLLKQALLNLIRNAVEASPDGGTVRLQAGTGLDGVSITVEDEGPGLPEAVREQLFAPFVTTKATGTGLGLAISKKVVERLGGGLRLLPRMPRGTTAELRFDGTHSGD